MIITKKLVMSFKTDSDNICSISIENSRTDVTEEEIKSAMDLIISKNIFAVKRAEFVTAVGAKIIETKTDDYDLVIE